MPETDHRRRGGLLPGRRLRDRHGLRHDRRRRGREVRRTRNPVRIRVGHAADAVHTRAEKTNELLFTGDKINAEEALSLGLINKVVALDELHSTARELALRIAPTPLAVLKLTKLALNRAYEAKGQQ